MTLNDVLNQMVTEAKKQNISLAELSVKSMHPAKRKSEVKLFLTRLGQQPDAGTTNFCMQAGQAIYSILGSADAVKQVLSVNPENIPNRYRNLPFYELMKNAPAAFVACLSVYEDSPKNSAFNGHNAVLNSAVSFADPAASTDKSFISDEAVNAALSEGLKNTSKSGLKGLFNVTTKPNAADMAISAGLTAAGLPIPPQAIHALGDFYGNIKDKIFSSAGENGQDLTGGWVEFYKYQKGGANYGQMPQTSPVSIGYWRTQFYPAIFQGTTAAGLNPPPVPSRGNKEEIAAAQAFCIVIYELYKKYYSELKDFEGVAFYNKMKELAKADPTNKTAAALINSTAINTSTTKRTELPEIGGIQTPWGNISWGVTNNKAMIIYAVIGAVVLISLIYLAKKKG